MPTPPDHTPAPKNLHNPHPYGTVDFEEFRLRQLANPARHHELLHDLAALDDVPTIDLTQHHPDTWLTYIYHPILIPDFLLPQLHALPTEVGTPHRAAALDTLTLAIEAHYQVSEPWYLYLQRSAIDGTFEFILMHFDH
jgi:hypothetical protein